MSPTLFVLHGIRIELRTKERGHNRPHVHAVGQGAEASIAIDRVEVLASRGFSKVALGRLVNFIEQERANLLEAWNDYHR
jgi:hypothetical protein